MKPVLALVGRPNVGKSTLFNKITKSRDALVANYPGLTRDRKYGTASINDSEFLVIDTGGLSGEDEGIDAHMYAQTWLAIEEADEILFLVDAKEGLTAIDEFLAIRLRATGKSVSVIVNKVDGKDPEQVAAEFYSLGFATVFKIAAAHGRGVRQMLEGIIEQYYLNLPVDEVVEAIIPDDVFDEDVEPDITNSNIKIAFVGRPNVGKSTLVNRILGEDRVVAFDQPGTTRDSIYVPFEREGQHYTLIDTAGVRRRGKIKETIEKFSIVKTYEAIDQANVVIMLLDAHEEVADQDAHLIGLILDAGRALVIAINKWDGLTDDDRSIIKNQLEIKLPFLNFAEKHFISALHGTGVGHLYESVHKAYRASMIKVSTSRLTKMLETAIDTHQPPLIRGRRIKLRYAHQGGSNPFTIIIHGNQTASVPNSYKRYLMNYFRDTLKLSGTQVKIEFKAADNPFEGRRDKRTPLQRYKEGKALRLDQRNKRKNG